MAKYNKQAAEVLQLEEHNLMFGLGVKMPMLKQFSRVADFENIEISNSVALSNCAIQFPLVPLNTILTFVSLAKKWLIFDIRQ